MCIIHRRTQGKCNDVIVCVCVCVCNTTFHFFERRLRECMMISALRQQLFSSLSRWQLFSPVADSTGTMDRFACCSTRTSRCGVRCRALQYNTSLTVCMCLLTDACEQGLCPPSLQCGSAVCCTFSSALRTPLPNTQNSVPVAFLPPGDACFDTHS
jgi:hypothetical protein